MDNLNLKGSTFFIHPVYYYDLLMNYSTLLQIDENEIQKYLIITNTI